MCGYPSREAPAYFIICSLDCACIACMNVFVCQCVGACPCVREGLGNEKNKHTGGRLHSLRASSSVSLIAVEVPCSALFESCLGCCGLQASSASTVGPCSPITRGTSCSPTKMTTGRPATSFSFGRC